MSNGRANASPSNADRTSSGERGSSVPPKPLNEQLHQKFIDALHQLDAELMDDRTRSADLVLVMRALRDDPIDRIRQLPVAAQRALSLVHSDADTSRLVQLFEQDPAMTQALLREANSTYYNPFGAPITSLSEAISRIGRTGVECVIIKQSMAGMVSRPGGELDAMAEQVWTHMVRVAPVARRVASAFDANADKAFLLGLLHDVGKLVVFDRITELRSSQRRVLAIDRTAIARVLRVLHEPLGGLVVHRWGLDGAIAHAVATHHREPKPDRHDPLAEVIYLTERVDLLRQARQTPDVVELWRSGALTGDITAATVMLEQFDELAATN